MASDMRCVLAIRHAWVYYYFVDMADIKEMENVEVQFQYNGATQAPWNRSSSTSSPYRRSRSGFI